MPISPPPNLGPDLHSLCISLQSASQIASNVEFGRQVGHKLRDLETILATMPDPESSLDGTAVDYLSQIVLSQFFLLQKRDALQSYALEPWFGCIRLLLTRTLWKAMFSPPLFQQWLLLLTRCIDTAVAPLGLDRHVQHKAILCIDALLPISTDPPLPGADQLVAYLRHKDVQPLLGQITTSLLDMALSDVDLAWRLDALHTLSRLLLDNVQVVDFLVMLLPGLASKLCRCIRQRGEKENHRIIVAALDFWGDLICATLADSVNEHLVQRPTTFQDLQRELPSEKRSDHSQQGVRTEEWLATVRQRLGALIDEAVKAQCYTHYGARLALIAFAGKVLSACPRTLPNCTELLLETLILYLDDEYGQVAASSQQRLDTLMRSDAVFLASLKTSLYDVLSRVPGRILMGDEDEKHRAMRLANGYVLVLKEQASSALDTALPRLSESYLHALEIEHRATIQPAGMTKYIDVVDSQHASATTLYPPIRFQHLITDRSTHQMTRLFNTIGRYGNLRFWIDHFVECLQEDTLAQVQPQAMYIIHSLLAGAAMREEHPFITLDDQPTRPDITKIGHDVLRDIMETVIDSSETRHTSKAVVPTQHGNSEENVMAICLALQVVGLVTNIVGGQVMQDELITTLYPLLVHLGSPTVLVHDYALITLNIIASICGYSSARQVCVDNLDYAINKVSQRIALRSECLRTAFVLRALIQLGQDEVVDQLEDTVQEIFDALDRYHADGWLCKQLCLVLVDIVKSVHTTAPALPAAPEPAYSMPVKQGVSREIVSWVMNRRKQDQKEANEDTPGSMEDIGRYFLDRQKDKPAEPNPDIMNTLEQEADAMEAADEAAEQEKEPSRRETMALEILYRTPHFLTSASSELRSQMLVMLGKGVQALRAYQSKMMPLINTVWPFVLRRLEDKTPYVVQRAVELMGICAEELGDFLSKRIETEVWPRLRGLLKNSDKHGYSTQHKLTSGVLLALTQMARCAPVSIQMAVDITEANKPFLRRQAPREHQQMAVDCLLALSERHYETVWLCVASLQAVAIPDFEIPAWMKMSDCSENARRVLVAMDSS
ncbi:armadillo-type protein [Syncephalastrum racemosum]|uniref:Armadillo-type protein n=1 Tax=Syncephalastrum racemosum TaxID=13706 RepID=A0A1X2HA70_SYNRA|nr:armadillo-type protein [Syncephalastrum racemosum]